MAALLLYTPEVLGLATSLSAWPWDEDLPFKGSARSKSCGSTLELGLALDREGRIDRVALLPKACAIGQAAAATFAVGAVGRSAAEIHEARDAISAWLADGGPLPGWPGLGALTAARDYPARHEAIMLAWRAASDLLAKD